MIQVSDRSWHPCFLLKGVFMKEYKILCLGDIVGEDAVNRVLTRLPAYIKENKVDFVVANGENALMGKGNGKSPAIAQSLNMAGVDVITGGNHSFASQSVYSFLDECNYLLRPANYPAECPGMGYTIVDGGGKRVLVMNVSGRIYMSESLGDPFLSVNKMLESAKGKYDISVLDVHAEATSEKFCIASAFDGIVNVVVGTHTHVPTADLRILPGGTGYITDLGMCGPENSSLGVKTEIALKKLRSGMPVRFELSKNPIRLEGAMFVFEGDRLSMVQSVRV